MPAERERPVAVGVFAIPAPQLEQPDIPRNHLGASQHDFLAVEFGCGLRPFLARGGVGRAWSFGSGLAVASASVALACQPEPMQPTDRGVAGVVGPELGIYRDG